MSSAVHAFPEDAGPAGRLAHALGVPMREIALHRFPDGEALPKVGAASGTAILYRGLAHPDEKLMPLLLAADALRRGGVRRLVLAAPYMPYLRQDKVFEPGQPLSRDVIGRLLGPAFDRILTVEPHLHRTHDLGPVFAGAAVTVLSAAEPLAAAIGPAGAPLIVGPDSESEAWAARVAGALGADCVVFEKTRLGDRQVSLSVRGEVAGRRCVLVDDIASSGGTLEAAIAALAARGAGDIEAAVVHALLDSAAEARLRAAGAARIVSTDSCDHPTNAIPLAGLIAGALQDEVRA